VNVDGVISLSDDFRTSGTPFFLPLGGTDKIIAPYWADVDTRGTGNIYYRQTTDPSLLARATSEIRSALSNSQVVSVENLLIVTWYRVGYFPQQTDKVRAIENLRNKVVLTIY